jgi:beta-lactamase superfamily II metal-dependent hydrolase
MTTPMKHRTVFILLLAAGAALVWIAVGQMPDGRLHVHMLDVESGQGVIVRTATGRVALIDGGAKPGVLLAALGNHLPFWQRTLHVVVATHQGETAILPLLEASKRYAVTNALGPAAGDHPTAVYQSWRSLLQEHRLSLTEVQAGAIIDMADGTLIEVAAVTSATLSIRISYGDVSLLLPGPQTAAPNALDATVVAFPLTRTTQTTVTVADAVQSVALFSGKRSSREQTLPAWPGVAVFSTARDGIIEMISDGATVTMRAQH